MLKLTDFRDKYKGKDIYVFGSGPSCNFIDPSFVDNKITIGTNQTWRKYNTNFLVRKEHNLLQETLNNYHGIVFVSEKHCGNHQKINPSKYKNNDRICVYKHLDNEQTINIEPFKFTDHLCVSYSTITTSIHLAYYLGAKNIILVGVDHGTIDGKITFDEYYNNINETPWQNWEQYRDWLKKLDSDTIIIKKHLESLGVNTYSINPFINFGLEGHKYE